ncbi:hypothetical protein BU16DRAFT_183131 [Lophium mytilinum]|uniref:Uncharacterized protein n=1 Tax=Lophium mytilinum TaxID=390894 RepID=A0A6A6QBI2_9PEZI|nr:hypothetical protein BU16DRAFT_183131 [Lophium mytilinum]
MPAPTGELTDRADIQYYNVGPLTTIWTPPDICLKTTTVVYNAGYAIPHVMSSFTDATNAGVNIRSECYPSWTSSLTATLIDKMTLFNSIWPDLGFYFYSPGVCPEGWKAACTQTTLIGNVEYNSVGLSIGKDTTLAMCCPSGFTCGTIGTYLQTCQQSSSGDISNVAEWNTNTPPTITSLGTMNLQNAELMAVSIIPILWENSDTDVLSLMGITPTGAYAPTSSSSSSTPAPSSTLSTALKTTFQSASRTTTPPPPSTSSAAPAVAQGKSRLSSGAKAGIAIGVIGAVAIFAGFLALFIRRRRSKQADLAATNRNGGHSDLPELRSPLTATALSATAEKHNAPETEPNTVPAAVPAAPTFAAASLSTQPSPARLDFLRSRIDAVRAEKERLHRMAELEALEFQLQREILEAQRMETGT